MVPPPAKPEKKPASKAVSIWANTRDRALFKRISKRAEKPFSEVVRVLVKNYDSSGRAPGLPKLASLKKAKKSKAKKSKAKVESPAPILSA